MNIKSSFTVPLFAALLATALSSAPAYAEEDAAALYQENCTKCHNSEVFTRADHKITSYDGLVRQVQRCELSLQLTWFDDEIKDVADYLNTHYYHFKH